VQRTPKVSFGCHLVVALLHLNNPTPQRLNFWTQWQPLVQLGVKVDQGGCLLHPWSRWNARSLMGTNERGSMTFGISWCWYILWHSSSLAMWWLPGCLRKWAQLTKISTSYWQ
jgi:hypothetical protein